jgi:hypothetical protein
MALFSDRPPLAPPDDVVTPPSSKPLGVHRYRIPNGLGTIGGTRHGPKKHGTSPALGTINRA